MAELTAEARRRAVHENYAERPGAGLWCFCDRLSYAAGETLSLHVNCLAPSYSLEIRRDHPSGALVYRRDGLPGQPHDTPEDCSAVGCGWPVSHSVPLPGDWPSGAYRVTLRAEGDGGAPLAYDHLFLLRPAAGQGAGRLLLIAATATWTAYNDWGGSNHYEGITGPGRDQFSPILSLARPLARGFVTLPAEAPRIPLQEPPPPGAPPRYPHMEWAYATGHSKKYASAGWASYERPFVHWAEAQGFRVDVASQHDLHFRPALLESYPCVVLVGHDEYWSWEMRDGIERYLEAGGRVARFAGNFMWQIRLEDEGRRQVCYKYRARAEDPLTGGPQAHLTTNSWEAPEVGRPGARTFGLNATSGIYVGWGAMVPRGAGGFPLYRPDHWAFDGTGLAYGDLLGAEARVFGYEVDGADYALRDGLPFPTGRDGAPKDMEILAVGQATLAEEAPGIAPEDLFVGLEDARFVAETLHGAATPETLARVKRGNGMMVCLRRGRGELFHAASCEWIAGLIRRDPAVERVTRNVLERYLSR